MGSPIYTSLIGILFILWYLFSTRNDSKVEREEKAKRDAEWSKIQKSIEAQQKRMRS